MLLFKLALRSNIVARLRELLIHRRELAHSTVLVPGKLAYLCKDFGLNKLGYRLGLHFIQLFDRLLVKVLRQLSHGSPEPVISNIYLLFTCDLGVNLLKLRVQLRCSVSLDTVRHIVVESIPGVSWIASSAQAISRLHVKAGDITARIDSHLHEFGSLLEAERLLLG